MALLLILYIPVGLQGSLDHVGYNLGELSVHRGSSYGKQSFIKAENMRALQGRILPTRMQGTQRHALTLYLADEGAVNEMRYHFEKVLI